MTKPSKYTSEYMISGIIKNISEITVLDEPVKILKVDLGHEENNESLLIIYVLVVLYKKVII